MTDEEIDKWVEARIVWSHKERDIQTVDVNLMCKEIVKWAKMAVKKFYKLGCETTEKAIYSEMTKKVREYTEKLNSATIGLDYDVKIKVE